MRYTEIYGISIRWLYTLRLSKRKVLDLLMTTPYRMKKGESNPSMMPYIKAVPL